MKEIIVHQVDITHYRLVELCQLADQAKPFYQWVEKNAKKITGSHKELNEIMMSATRDEMASIIYAATQNRKKSVLYSLMVLAEFTPTQKPAFTFLPG